MPNLSSLITALKTKKEFLLLWLRKNHPASIKEAKHLSEGSEARAYWYYGYLMAIIDIIKKLEQIKQPASATSAVLADPPSNLEPPPPSSFSWKKTFGIIIILLLAMTISYAVGDYRAKATADARLMELINETERIHTEVRETKNKYSDAVDAIKELSDENTQLVDLVADLRVRANKPPVIKEIIVTRTVIKPSEPIYITSEIPEEYSFKLEPGLEVAKFAKIKEDGKEKFSFITRELSVRNSVVIGEDKSTALLQIASSAEPDKYYEIPIDEFEVRTVEPKKKLFKPDIALSIRAGLNESPQLTGALNLTLLHPLRCVDTVGVSIAGNSQTFQAGFIPFAYNIGCHLPVFDDLWLITDAFVDIHAKFGAGIGIGTKF